MPLPRSECSLAVDLRPRRLKVSADFATGPVGNARDAFEEALRLKISVYLAAIDDRAIDGHAWDIPEVHALIEIGEPALVLSLDTFSKSNNELIQDRLLAVISGIMEDVLASELGIDLAALSAAVVTDDDFNAYMEEQDRLNMAFETLWKQLGGRDPFGHVPESEHVQFVTKCKAWYRGVVSRRP